MPWLYILADSTAFESSKLYTIPPTWMNEFLKITNFQMLVVTLQLSVHLLKKHSLNLVSLLCSKIINGELNLGPIHISWPASLAQLGAFDTEIHVFQIARGYVGQASSSCHVSLLFGKAFCSTDSLIHYFSWILKVAVDHGVVARYLKSMWKLTNIKWSKHSQQLTSSYPIRESKLKSRDHA